MSVMVWDSSTALPKDLDDALQLIRQLKNFQGKPNPKFLALAQELFADSAFAGRWGAERLLEAAADCTCAIWEPDLPAGDAMPAIRAVIQHATGLGLVVYCDPMQVVFLPGGGTVTPERKALHDEGFEYYDSKLRMRAKVCHALLKGFTEHFSSLGFSPSNLDPTESNRFAALSFYDRHLAELSRFTSDGWQRLVVGVNHHEADSEYFECEVRAGIRNDLVEAIFTNVFGEGIRFMDTFLFWPAFFVSDRACGFKATNELLVRELPRLVEALAMPVLDVALELDGLDEVMNTPLRFPFTYPLHPLTPQNLADSFINRSQKQACLKTLIVAWLNKNPNFNNRATDLREFVKTRVDVSENDLNRLIEHLHAHCSH